MDLNIETFTRKPFDIKAVRITEENMETVAEWSGGTIEIQPAGKVSRPEKKYISFGNGYPIKTVRQSKGFIGDWVICYDEKNFKALNNRAFHTNFDKKGYVDYFRIASTDIETNGPDPRYGLTARIGEAFTGQLIMQEG